MLQIINPQTSKILQQIEIVFIVCSGTIAVDRRDLLLLIPDQNGYPGVG